MLKLPANFENDIQGRDTSLVPLVLIGKWQDPWDTMIKISTNDYVHTGEAYNIRWKPLLLNIPSLKESIDIEKRNYKISSVNLDISNFPYEGKRFSEVIAENSVINGSLINVQCRIFWASPSTLLVRGIDIDSNYTAYEDDYAFQVYYGTIRRYTHDDGKVRLVVEDRSQSTLHTDLPNHYIDTNNSIPSKYRNKPIPMVYGHVNRSPLVSESYGKWIADSLPINDFYNDEETGYDELSLDDGRDNYSSLWMEGDSSLINVIKEDNNYNQSTQYTDDDNEIIFSFPIVPALATSDDFSHIELLCRDFSNDYVTTLSNTLDDPLKTTDDYDSPPGSLRKMFDNSQDHNPITWSGQRSTNDMGLATSNHGHEKDLILFYDIGFGGFAIDFRSLYNLTIQTGFTFRYEFLLLKVGFNFEPSYDHIGYAKIIGMKINNIDVSDILVPQNQSGFGMYGTGAIVMQTSQGSASAIGGDSIWGISEHYEQFPKFTDMTYFSNNLPAFPILEDLFNFPSALGNAIGGYNDNANIQFFATADQIETETLIGFNTGSISNIDEIEFMREISATNIFDKNFYANVKGRQDSFGTLIENPDRIIMGILKDELNAVPSYDSGISYSGYSSWKYAFTVDKKINSKKLIEGIASASPYIPHFNNMGEFKFDVIPVLGGTDSGSSIATIKESDVIKFSFSRTPIENVYTKVEFKYNWNYVMDEFNDIATADIISLHLQASGAYAYDFNYYGLDSPYIEPITFKNIHPRSTLVIDDDRGKYIRDDNTAQEFAMWQLLWSCNQHLKLTIKLPLKYMNLEIGDLVDFDRLIGEISPYGIDYTNNALYINAQRVYKNFLITSTNKTLESVEIECIQLHSLYTYADYAPETTFEGGYDENDDPAIIYEQFYPHVALDYTPINNIRSVSGLENLILIQSYEENIATTWNEGSQSWLGSLTDLDPTKQYNIAFSSGTTTNLFYQ